MSQELWLIKGSAWDWTLWLQAWMLRSDFLCEIQSNPLPSKCNLYVTRLSECHVPVTRAVEGSRCVVSGTGFYLRKLNMNWNMRLWWSSGNPVDPTLECPSFKKRSQFVRLAFGRDITAIWTDKYLTHRQSAVSVYADRNKCMCRSLILSSLYHIFFIFTNKLPN